MAVSRIVCPPVLIISPQAHWRRRTGSGEEEGGRGRGRKMGREGEEEEDMTLC
jgi:hypothetical protein